MSDDAAIRRANLRLLCKRRGWSPRALAQAAAYGRYTYWRDLLEGTDKAFGEKAARKIEESLGLERGYLDTPHTEGAHRYPIAQERIAAREPPAPPPGFADRMQVSESDWALLADVKLAATAEELARIRERADLFRSRVDAILLERQERSKGNS